MLAEHGVGTESAVLARLAKAAEPGTIELRGPSFGAGEEGALTFKKPTSSNPAIRKRQELVDSLLKKLPYEAKGFGELARFGRELKRGPEATSAAFRQQAADYFDAYGKLSKPERKALAVMSRLPLEKYLDQWKQTIPGTPEAADTAKILGDEKVMQLYREPTKKMLAALEESRKLGQTIADTVAAKGVLTPVRRRRRGSGISGWRVAGRCFRRSR
jgi:hypothetical protein